MELYALVAARWALARAHVAICCLSPARHDVRGAGYSSATHFSLTFTQIYLGRRLLPRASFSIIVAWRRRISLVRNVGS